MSGFQCPFGLTCILINVNVIERQGSGQRNLFSRLLHFFQMSNRFNTHPSIINPTFHQFVIRISNQEICSKNLSWPGMVFNTVPTAGCRTKGDNSVISFGKSLPGYMLLHKWPEFEGKTPGLLSK